MMTFLLKTTNIKGAVKLLTKRLKVLTREW